MSKAPVKKAEQHRRAEFEARQERIKRLRGIVSLAAVVPLVASLACGYTNVPGVCAVPREIYLGIWAAVFGTFLGLTFRMWRDRRNFEKSAATT